MYNRFVKTARAIVEQAEQEARASGSTTVEAEHLLLALTSPQAGEASDVLADAGLDGDQARSALRTQFERSLSVAGMRADPDLPPAGPPTGKLPFATSVKLSLERALEAAQHRKDRRIEPLHLLLGVLAAEAGNVPLALAGAGIDVAQLQQRVHARLGQPH